MIGMVLDIWVEKATTARRRTAIPGQSGWLSRVILIISDKEKHPVKPSDEG